MKPLMCLLLMAIPSLTHADPAHETAGKVRAKAPAVVWNLTKEQTDDAWVFWKDVTKGHKKGAELLRELEKYSGVTQLDLSKTGEQANADFFYALSLTPSGRELLRPLLPLIWEGKVSFLPLNSKEALHRDWPHFSEGKIFLGRRGPLGEISTLAAHEMAHAFYEMTSEKGKARALLFSEQKQKISDLKREIDADLKQLEKNGKGSREEIAEKQKSFAALTAQTVRIGAENLIRSERFAYYIQDRINREMEKEIPEYREAMNQYYRRVGLGTYPVTEEAFRKVLKSRVSSTDLDRYFEKQTWEKPD